MSHLDPSSHRRWRLIAAASLGIPAAFAAAWCLLLRPEAKSVVAPLLGPWAGHLYGHQECTLAAGAPTATVLAVALGVVAFAALAFLRRSAAGLVALLPAALWSLGWSAMALLSVANTCS